MAFEGTRTWRVINHGFRKATVARRNGGNSMRGTASTHARRMDEWRVLQVAYAVQYVRVETTRLPHLVKFT